MKGVEIKTIIWMLILIFSILISLNFASAETNVTDCGTLNTTDAVYTLNQSLNSSFNCLNINATNITLDCLGYSITFGNATGGKGIFVDDGEEGGYDNITIQNCILVQNESGADHTAIFFGGGSENGIIYNNTIIVFGLDTPGVLFESNSVNANISSNNITTSGELGFGIVLSENGSGADIRNNIITTSGNDSSGIKIGDYSSDGLIYNNTITTSGDWSAAENTTLGGIFLDILTDNINVSTNTITMSGYNTAGIWVWSCYNHSIENNIITSSGESGDGIFLSDLQGVNITSNTINVTGNFGDGIYSYISEDPILFYNNVITTSGAYSYGFNLAQDSNNNISSNNITTSGVYSYGMFFNQSHNTTLSNNIITTGDSTSYALYLITSANETFYNNLFNTSTSGSGIYIEDSDLSYFNTTESIATNIIGGPSIGGNFWTNNAGTGFSDNCLDADTDYFCDSTYTIVEGENHTDYLPLTNRNNMVSVCRRLDVVGRIYYLNQSITEINETCFNVTANNITLDFRGYNITGNSTGYGVNVTGYNDTTVKDGFIYNFSIGIYFGGSVNNNITNMTSNNNNLRGIAFSTSSNNNLTTIIVNDNSAHGIILESSNNNIFTDVTANSNTFFGLYLDASSSNTFTSFNISDSGINLNNASSNAFTNFNINDSTTDAIALTDATSDNNNFTNVIVTNTSSSKYDIKFNAAGIDGTWIIGINFANYTFTGAGGKVNFKEPSYGEIKFIEAINGSGISLATDIDIESDSIFVNSSSNTGLNKSANITLYGISYTDPKPQYSSDGSTYTDCTSTTNPACTELSYNATTNIYSFNVSHFTYFKATEAYTASATTTPSSSGGGGGGGGTTTNKTHKKTQYWTKITPGAVTIMKITDPEIGFKQINITVVNPAQKVTITVTKLDGKPASVVHEVTGKVYKYIDVTTKNLKDEDLDKIKIQFEVNKSWINGNNIDSNTVALNRYSFNAWERLQTRKTSEDNDFVYYESDTTGFSTFAITGEVRTEATITTIPVEATTIPLIITTTIQAVISEAGSAVWPVVIIIIAAIVGFWLYKRGLILK